MRNPYLLFLGDARDALAAKTAQGLADWRPGWCVGQLRLPGCQADVGLPDLTIAAAAAAGARTLVIGLASSGGALLPHWVPTLLRALDAGLDLANGLHDRLSDHPEIAAAAGRLGRTLHDVRHCGQTFATGTGRRRSGRRVLTVGTDCSVGKMYTALAIERELRRLGRSADFRATGQTGILIAGQGIAIDAVVADFIAGAAEALAPDHEPEHWDVIEGQGSLFHPAFAGVTLGLLHGSQPDALVLCHEPTRQHLRGLPQAPVPDLEACVEPYLQAARLTSPACRLAGVSLNTRGLDPEAARRLIAEVEDRLSVVGTDPLRFGVSRLVERLLGDR